MKTGGDRCIWTGCMLIVYNTQRWKVFLLFSVSRRHKKIWIAWPVFFSSSDPCTWTFMFYFAWNLFRPAVNTNHNPSGSHATVPFLNFNIRSGDRSSNRAPIQASPLLHARPKPHILVSFWANHASLFLIFEITHAYTFTPELPMPLPEEIHDCCMSQSHVTVL